MVTAAAVLATGLAAAAVAFLPPAPVRPSPYLVDFVDSCWTAVVELGNRGDEVLVYQVDSPGRSERVRVWPGRGEQIFTVVPGTIIVRAGGQVWSWSWREPRCAFPDAGGSTPEPGSGRPTSV